MDRRTDGQTDRRTDVNELKGKRVLVTGHTGFKGTWLCRLLNILGAEVFGIGLDEGGDKIFQLSHTETTMTSIIQNICEYEKVRAIIQDINPHIVFHLAAQPLVIEGYKTPLETFSSNVMGTAHVLEACRYCENVEAIICVTTDKVYQNNEWVYPYRETDPLGGHDPYSASKAACEMVISSYRESFFHHKKIVSMRAGNVIGGGDFAENRIIPDIVRSIQNHTTLLLRAANSIRPWQHVLDALWGYILASLEIIKNGETPSASYNIAPVDNSSSHTVLYLVQTMFEVFEKGEYEIVPSDYKEMTRLQLDPSLIKEELGWFPAFTTHEAIQQTAYEYKQYLQSPHELDKQIDYSIKNFLGKVIL